MDTADRAMATWTAAPCPFALEYSPRVLDDIRLAVTDAFFSLPRGGVEIGGVLLGRHLPGRVVIEGYVALDCEHAFGPSFTLSANDHAQLEQLLAKSRRGPDSAPVGWYHSHTRSEIFFSPVDIEIHRRFFPEPWQVALVLRPRTMGPTGAGFFFYELDGSIRGESTCAEFALENMPALQVPVAPPPPSAPPSSSEPMRNGPVIDIAAIPQPAAPEPPPRLSQPETTETRAAAAPRELVAPNFAVAPPRSPILLAGIFITVGLALGAVGYQTRDRWIPQLAQLGVKLPGTAAAPSEAPQSPPVVAQAAASVNFSAIDADGQLQLRWDRASPLVLNSTGALLVITDGATPPQALGLDAAHLQAGNFSYARQTGKVDVVLTVHLQNGQDLKEIATFLGEAPGRPAAEREKELADQAAKLEEQAARTKKLERTIRDMRSEMQREAETRRKENQASDAVKK